MSSLSREIQAIQDGLKEKPKEIKKIIDLGKGPVDSESLENLKKQVAELKKSLHFFTSNPGSGGTVNENFKLRSDMMKEIGRSEQKVQQIISEIRGEVEELKGPVNR